MTAEPTRFGRVAIIGITNAGKSTLLNRLVGAKVAIVTPKPQTTRSRILGIAMVRPAQLVFVDTPGIFQPKRRLDRAMVEAAWSAIQDADLVVLLVDATVGLDAGTGDIVAKLRRAGRRAVLVLNKVDAVKRESLLALAAAANDAGDFSKTFMISALTGDGVGDMAAYLAQHVPPGPWHYPEDQLADMPERVLAAEITREQLYLRLRQEVPYACAVETERWQEQADGSVRIDQVVFVQRDSQKPIVLGAGGQGLKAIGTAARQEMARLLGRPVHLFLFVKVRPEWAEDPERYRAIGLEFPQ